MIAYPPNWEVEEERGSVSFASPDGLVTVMIESDGRRRPTANIDVQRDVYWNAAKQVCANSGIEATPYNTFSGVRFASLRATCDFEGVLLMYYVGAGLRDAVEWDFTLFCLYKDFETNANRFFDPMLNSLNIYANP